MQKKIKIVRFKQYSLALLFILFGFQNTAFSQNEDVIRIDTNLVTVPVTVFDRDGRYITYLKKENFQILEDGNEQNIELFKSVEQPVTVLLVLDISGSMTKYMTNLTEAANIFVHQLRSDDRVAAATFADNLYVLLKPTKVSELRKGIKIKQRSRDHFTRIYDAVHDALKLMRKIRGRKAIVLFSDGGGDGTFASAKDNFRHAEEGEALIYTVQFKNFLTAPHPHQNKEIFYEAIENANNYMLGLAQISGGRDYQIEKITDLNQTFAHIAAELRQQYNLGYYPNNPGKEGERRQIKVKVNVPNVAVRSRDSYIIGSQKK